MMTIAEWIVLWKQKHPESTITTYSFDQINLIRADVNNQLFLWDVGVQGQPPNYAPVDRRIDETATYVLPAITVTVYPTSPPVDTIPSVTPFAPSPSSSYGIKDLARRAAQRAWELAAAQASAAQAAASALNKGILGNPGGGIFTTPSAPPAVQPPISNLPPGGGGGGGGATPANPVNNPGSPIVPIPQPGTPITLPGFPGNGGQGNMNPGTGVPNPGYTGDGHETASALRNLGTFAILTSPAWLALLFIERKKLSKAFGR